MKHENSFLKQAQRVLHVFKRPAARWTVALVYTLFVTVLLVQSSSQPVVGPPAPPGAPDLRREIELIAGHVVVFAVLVVVWWWALSAILPVTRAMFVTLGFALIYGVITELAQVAVADREPSLFDVAVNWTVTVATGINLYRLAIRRSSIFDQPLFTASKPKLKTLPREERSVIL